MKTTPNKMFIENNILTVQLSSFIFWYLCSYLMISLLKWDIYKIIIGVGTFALALAFAGNDLVNFIGVPIAAFQSYEAWVSSGVGAESFNMTLLSERVPTPTIFLFISGMIMILTLWLSSKARKVVKTSLDLSNQYDTKERFEPNFLSRGLVRFFVYINAQIKKGQTVMIVQNDGSGSNKAVVSAVDNSTAPGKFTAYFYEAGGLVTAGTGATSADVTVFIYGSEFRKGTAGMVGSLEANDFIFENKPIIIKDTYNVSGSDMAQIGWVEINTED